MIHSPFLSGVILGSLALIVSLGGILSADWANGTALIGGTDYYSRVKLGLWYGLQESASNSPDKSIHYMWCSKGLESYDAASCSNVRGAQVTACMGVISLCSSISVLMILTLDYVKRKAEPTVILGSAMLALVTSICFLITCSMWARLVVSLSQSTHGGLTQAQLSVGISWLAQAAGFVLALLQVINLYFMARRAERELPLKRKPSMGAPADMAPPAFNNTARTFNNTVNLASTAHSFNNTVNLANTAVNMTRSVNLAKTSNMTTRNAANATAARTTNYRDDADIVEVVSGY